MFNNRDTIQILHLLYDALYISYIAVCYTPRYDRQIEQHRLNLRAAFDTVNRGIVIRTMRKEGIRNKMVIRVEEMMRETKSRITVEKEMGEEFWSKRNKAEILVEPDAV